jgi:glycosyltransferase involved in cell wall biosynthesis
VISEHKIHVLLVIRTLSGAGAELVVETISRFIDRKRFDITICELVGTGEKAQGLREMGYDVVSLLPNGNVRMAYFNFLRLRRLVANRRINVIHSHCAASLADAVICRFLKTRLKVIHTFHFGNYPYVEPSIKRLERAFCRYADILVSVGYDQAVSIRATYSLPKIQIETIWNGIEPRTPRIDSRRLEPFLGKGRVIIGMIGTLSEQKGHMDMLEVASLLKQRGVPAVFLIVGGGPLRDQLEERCRALDLTGTVEFLGWVKDAAEVLLPAFDIFFQPSRWEAMSMVLLEAAVAAKPIVCTDVGEATRIFTDGEGALITRPADVLAMTEALERLIRDRALRRRLGDSARATIQRCCLADTMVRKYERLYLKLGQRTCSEAQT